MKFSILIPVYNVEKFIDECMKSVLSQTYTDFEVILVDDGSTDSSGRICDSYADKDSRVKAIHKPNEGLISARRVGIENACGEYSVFIDSDDAVQNCLLSTLDEYISGYGADMVLYSFVYYDGKKTAPRNKKLFEDGYVLEGENKKELYESFISSPDYYAICTKCVRTDIMKADDIDYKKYYCMNMSEDVLQSLYPITHAKKIIFADKELYLYRYNPGSVSHVMDADTIYKKNTSHVFKMMREYMPVWGIADEEHMKQVTAAQFSYVMYTFSLYYRAVPKQDRKKVVDFDWDSFLFPGFEPNEYCGENSRMLYEMINGKRYGEIERHFLKQNAYEKYKKLKKRFGI